MISGHYYTLVDIMPFDKWGIPFLYPTKKTAGVTGTGTGFFWEQSNNVHDDDDYEGDAMLRIGKEHDSSDFKVISTTTGEWQFPFNFDSGDGLSLSGPTGHHTGGETHGCQGFTYMINVSLEDTPPKFRFRKETYHVQYNNDPQYGLWTHTSAPDKIVGGGWFGYCWVIYNKKDGVSAGKDSRIMEVWWNNDPAADIKNWVMLKRKEDKPSNGNWGVSATCDGDAYQIGTWSNIQFRFKIDASDFSLHPLKPEPDGTKINSIGGENMSFSDSENRGYGYRADMPRDVEMKCLFKMDDTSGNCRFKNVSIREIDPSLSFDDTPPTPEEPPTGGGSGGGAGTTLQGSFKLQWDLNQLRTSPCAGTGTGGGGGGGGGGTPTGNAIFYDIALDSEKELSDSSTWQNRKIVAQQCILSSSNMNGKLLRQVDIPLKKAGSPGATPTIRSRIWNSGGAVIYTSPTEINPTTLTTSYQTFTFDFSGNTHTLVVGDRVGVQYTGTSSSDYVLCGYQGTSTLSGSQYTAFEGSSWDVKTGREVALTMWE